MADSENRDSDGRVAGRAGERNFEILARYASLRPELEPRYLLQAAHLTTPATVWKYAQKAAQSRAHLVMLDLEDSIPRGDVQALQAGRANVIRAFTDLDWGNKLRFFRPRGLALDPGFEDVIAVIRGAGDRVDGLVYPKVESAEEVKSLDLTLEELERELGLAEGTFKVEVLIESVRAEQNLAEIAGASPRLIGLVFGAFDYWASLGIVSVPFRIDHPLLHDVRIRIVKAASVAGIPAIAEMNFNYPTSDKTDEQKQAALDEFRADALMARDLGFHGKWTGIPAQTAIALEVFGVPEELIADALSQAREFLEAERKGRGAAMIGGIMVDRAVDRMNRNVLKMAYAMGRMDDALARELGII